MDGQSDLSLSIFSSGTAFFLLFAQGWTVTGFLVFATFLYFLSKLVRPQKVNLPEDFHVVIVGAGVSGICMGKKLNDIGVKYTILEKSGGLGGTWYDNIYPGVACDVPSHLYSFSFYLNPYWSRAFSGGKEIHGYLQRAASRFGVYPHIEFNKRVISSTWDKDTALWTVLTEDGAKYNANVFVAGSGGLHVPRLPKYQGMEEFQGESFHTALWHKNFDPRNKRVAVIGTGASAVQTVPNLSELGVKEMKVFQRTPCWAPPRLDYQYPEFVKKMFAMVPFTNMIHRWFFFWRSELRFHLIFKEKSVLRQKASQWVHSLVRRHIRHVVKDKELAEKLTPDFSMGCKRITPSDTYLQAFNKEFVHLVTDKIECITERGVRTTDGVEHEVDTIVYATGFDLLRSANPFKTVGLNKNVLAETFSDIPNAYLSVTHYDNPNAFMLLGPGSGLGHNSIIYVIECQANYVIDAIKKLASTGARSLVVKKEVQEAYWDWTQRQMKGKVFADNSMCTGWYRNDRGINWTLWPEDLVTFWWWTKSVNLDEYNLQY